MQTEIKKLVDVCRRLYERGLIAGSEGNVSLRLDDGRLLATPSGRNKGWLEPEDISCLDMAGRLVSGPKPSSEIRLHIHIYNLRSDVRAVVHTHPPYVLGVTLAGYDLRRPLLAEGALFFADLEMAPFAVPGSDEVPAVVEPFIRRSKAVILERHGLVTLGADLEEAFNLTDMLEHLARTHWLAYTLNPGVLPLGIEELDRLRRFYPCLK